MDVIRNIVGGFPVQVRSTVSILLSVSLYIIYLFVNYSSKNLPSESLMPSYDFIIVGGGTAGTFFHNIDRKLHHKRNENIRKKHYLCVCTGEGALYYPYNRVTHKSNNIHISIIQCTLSLVAPSIM